jgi:hypothetical protein
LDKLKIPQKQQQLVQNKQLQFKAAFEDDNFTQLHEACTR